MTTSARNVLAAFDALPPEDQSICAQSLGVGH